MFREKPKKGKMKSAIFVLSSAGLIKKM